MKTFNLTTLLLLFVALAFTSCQKDKIDPVDFSANSETENAAKPAAKKWYIKQVLDENGLIAKTFNYDVNKKLSSINYSAGLVQNLTYGVTGNLESIETIDLAKGQILNNMSYQYNAVSNLPELVHIFTYNTGAPVLESTTHFTWGNNGQKTMEVTRNVATGVEQKTVYLYSNGNMTFARYFVDNAASGVKSFLQFDAAKNPFKNTPALTLIPSFESHNKNVVEVLIDKDGSIVTELASITYNNQNLPTSIECTINGSPASKTGFTYIKL